MKTILVLLALHAVISIIALSLFGALMLAKLTLHPKTFGRFLREDMPSRNLVAMWLFFPVMNVLGAFMILSILLADLWVGRREIYAWARDERYHAYPEVVSQKSEGSWSSIKLSDHEKKQVDQAGIPRCDDGCTIGQHLVGTKCDECKTYVQLKGD